MPMKVLGNCQKGLAFVISAPAGTGKTTLVQMLMQEFPSVVENISFTTRQPRPDEIDGVHYHFIDQTEFEKKIAANEFLEYVQLYGYYYGTSWQSIKKLQNEGKHVLLVIDTQGAMELKKKHFPAIFIFLKPPSVEALRQRLSARKTESHAKLEERLAWSQREMQAIQHYDYCIINDVLETAYQVLRSILIAEEHRVSQLC